MNTMAVPTSVFHLILVSPDVSASGKGFHATSSLGSAIPEQEGKKMEINQKCRENQYEASLLNQLPFQKQGRGRGASDCPGQLQSHPLNDLLQQLVSCFDQ